MAKINDKRMYQLLERFANEHTLGKNINVTISPHHTSYTPLNELKGDAMKYEDVVLLSEIVRGAESFLMWVRRNGVKI